jgi:hypothetical protein
MSEPKLTSTIKVERTGEELKFEVEHLTFEISEKDKPQFLKDPGGFLSELLRANNETVNGLMIEQPAIELLKKQVEREARGSTTTWHCIAPPTARSRRIVVTQTK